MKFCVLVLAVCATAVAKYAGGTMEPPQFRAKARAQIESTSQAKNDAFNHAQVRFLFLFIWPTERQADSRNTQNKALAHKHT